MKVPHTISTVDILADWVIVSLSTFLKEHDPGTWRGAKIPLGYVDVPWLTVVVHQYVGSPAALIVCVEYKGLLVPYARGNH